MVFPDISLAMEEPNGLLAVGGDLSVKRLLNAYRHGIFPWFSDDQPILWWSPNPRMVLIPTEIKISRSLKKTIRKNSFEISFDRAFDQVLLACAQPRPKQPSTWITDEMREAYNKLHKLGYAHSFECWQNEKLVGGLYGISMGKMFFGESMFSFVTDASKIAFVQAVNYLKNWNYALIDCQVETEHLASFGAKNINRNSFRDCIEKLIQEEPSSNAWNTNLNAPEQASHEMSD